MGTGKADAPVATRHSSGGVPGSGREHRVFTAIDDHWRFVVAATVLLLPSGPAVCDAFLAAIARWGAPFEVLNDNGKQFTDKFHQATTQSRSSSSRSACQRSLNSWPLALFENRPPNQDRMGDHSAGLGAGEVPLHR